MQGIAWLGEIVPKPFTCIILFVERIRIGERTGNLSCILLECTLSCVLSAKYGKVSRQKSDSGPLGL